LKKHGVYLGRDSFTTDSDFHKAVHSPVGVGIVAVHGLPESIVALKLNRTVS
jgi:hypothetical protein